MKRGLWTILIALLMILWLFLLCLMMDGTRGGTFDGETKKEILRVMRYHGVDVLLTDWNGNIFIERNGKRIKVGRE